MRKKLLVLLIGLSFAVPVWAVGTMIVMSIYGLATAGAMTAGMMAAAFVINFAVSTLISRAFTKKPPKVQDNGIRQQIPPATTNSIPVVYGDAYLGGMFIDAVLSTTNGSMWYVLGISHISPNGQFTFDKTKFYYGDRLITFDTTEPAKVVSLTDGDGNVDTKIADNLYIYLYRSTDAGVITNLDNGGTSPGSGLPSEILSNSVFPNNGVPTNLQWPSTGRQMNGLAFAIVKLNYSQVDDAVQLQQLTFKCSHYLNSAGVAKPGDVWYDYITSPIYGGAIDTSLVDSASATALNTYSDQTITFTNNQGDPATQARYRINGVIDTNQPVLENLDQILISADSWMAYDAPNGKWSIIINKAETSALNFNDTNIIGEIKVSTLDINQAINQIEAKFPSKLNKDIPDYVFIETPSGLLYPNEPINKYSITFDLVNDSVQAQYLCNRMLEQAREDLIVNIKTTYAGIQINAGDVISITNSSYGWTNKLFRTMKVNEASLPDGSLGAALELSEYNVQVYDDKPITEFQPTPNSELPSSQFFSNLQVPTVSASRPAVSIPSFDVQVYIPASGRVTYLQLFYTTSSTPTSSDWFLLWQVNLSSDQVYTNNTYYTFTNMFLPAATYYFGYKVGNETSVSQISSKSVSFVWNPVGMSGFSGFSGYSGYSGKSGISGFTGPRTATGFVYYELSSSSAPSAPTLSGYNFDTGAFSSISTNWTTTFTPPNPSTNVSTEAGSKFWAVRYYVTEATYGGTQTITTSSVFNWQNLNGLVTFTNVTTDSGTTFIDGGNIKANTISATKINVSSLSAITSNLGDVTAGTMAIGTGGAISSTIPGYSLSGSTPPSPGVTGGRFYLGSTGYTYMDTPVVYGQLFGSTIGFKAGVTSPDAYFENTTSNANAHGVKAVIPGTSSGYAFYTDQDAYIAGGVLPFTGVHQVLVKENYELGDIVCDVSLIGSNGLNNTIFYVEESTGTNQPALGVFAGLREWGSDSKPFALQNLTPEEYAQIVNEYTLADVSAVGEGKINICGENGNIQIGDLIVTSSTPGKGMKQADDIVRSYTVAKAREATTFDNPTDIKMIACIYLAG